MEEELQALGSEAVDYIKRILQSEDRVATGELLNSISYEVLTTINGFLLKITAADYFKYVDQGRRPGFAPPTSSILKWIRAKNIIFSGKTEQQTAFVIARSIGVKGIKPANIKARLVTDILNNQANLLRNAAGNEVEDHLSKILNSKV